MKPPPFDYRRAFTPEDAVARLAAYGDEAKVIAGGQSLVPMLALRIARPSVLVDISRLGELRGVFAEDGVLRIGALARHRDMQRLPGDGFGVLRRAVPLIGHEPIRTRGTVGGSLAHADPAAEWPLLAVLLDAEIVALGPAGRRTIGATDFLQGYFSTALAPDELLAEIRFPRPWPGAALREHARRHGDFALVAAAAAVDLDADGRCREARVALGAIADVPLRIEGAEALLAGTPLDDAALDEACELAADAIDPPGDIHASAEHRRRLARVLLREALTEARERAAT